VGSIDQTDRVRRCSRLPRWVLESSASTWGPRTPAAGGGNRAGTKGGVWGDYHSPMLENPAGYCPDHSTGVSYPVGLFTSSGDAPARRE
jgi:hypothetical protein